jgi:hypothetical protein
MKKCKATHENGTGTPHMCGRPKGHAGKHSCSRCETRPPRQFAGGFDPGHARFRWQKIVDKRTKICYSI